MAFKIKEMEVKLGMTVEINGTWTRVDNGLILENTDLDSILKKSEIMEQFQKAEMLLEEELVRRIKKIKG
ncbi:MAG: hypothetical protein IIW92_01090 [Lachnospiraceae bacterium]|jgi:hypothetical protein|nr:hypothetical protein [Lachnospiraceae bacterium]